MYSATSQNTEDIILHMIDLKYHMNKILSIDVIKKTITIEGGVTLKQVLDALSEEGSLSMPNLPSITGITVAGLISTGTHGTGINNQVMASMVTEIEFVSGTGELIVCSKTEREDLFNAMQCSLGALGIITRLTLQVESAYRLECFERTMNINDLLDNYESLLMSNDFFRFWWIPHT